MRPFTFNPGPKLMSGDGSATQLANVQRRNRLRLNMMAKELLKFRIVVDGRILPNASDRLLEQRRLFGCVRGGCWCRISRWRGRCGDQRDEEQAVDHRVRLSQEADVAIGPEAIKIPKTVPLVAQVVVS